MVGIGPLSLLVIVLMLAAVTIIGGGLLRLVGSLFHKPNWGHVSLDCPHCDKPTRADRPLCESCGEQL